MKAERRSRKIERSIGTKIGRELRLNIDRLRPATKFCLFSLT